MIENCELRPPPLSRNSRQQHKPYSNNSFSLSSSLCISRVINLSRRTLKGPIISIIVAILSVVVLFPKASLSSPISSQNEAIASNIREEAFLYPGHYESGLSDFEDPSTSVHRMKRNINYEDEDAMENADSWSEDGNGIDIGKRGGDNNRARRVSMMRLKKDLKMMKMRLQYPKRMSMMRLRREFFPVRDYNRATRGMGKVSMLRLKKAPSYMRLKKMTQMRLKKMTQMRLKKSGNPQLSNNYVDDLDKLASEAKRDLEETAPVVIANDPEGMY